MRDCVATGQQLSHSFTSIEWQRYKGQCSDVRTNSAGDWKSELNTTNQNNKQNKKEEEKNQKEFTTEQFFISTKLEEGLEQSRTPVQRSAIKRMPFFRIVSSQGINVLQP